ncbi:MAG: redoxin domain-containing protein [Lachnospiraceae bacterium]|nr:redoxin domain-containing protein [Lachnospiraceae bacterium]
MQFSLDISISAITVFFQGLLSFFSPCVLPLVPLYISYFSGSAKTVDENGTIHYPRRRIFMHTLFFVVGISAAFFLLGFGFTALGQFFQDNRIWFSRISGLIMLFFGLYQLGIFGRSTRLDQEHHLPLPLEKMTMSPLTALLLGFTFSFAWTPCVGPALSSVLLMAGSSDTTARGFLLIGIYTLGFVIPFLAVGLFTGTVLNFFKTHKSVVRYTVKIGAVLLIIMGIMTLTGFMNNASAYLADNTSSDEKIEQEATVSDASAPDSETAADPDAAGTAKEAAETEEESDAVAAPNFILKDQYGNSHDLSAYKGKTVFLNFWATWCGPCRSEMPEIQKLYEKYGLNGGDLIVLGVASPNIGQEGSQEEITAFLEENGYTFPVVMDDQGLISNRYGISAYPTTFMIDTDGNVFGYVSGALSLDVMESIVEQTMSGERAGQ